MARWRTARRRCSALAVATVAASTGLLVAGVPAASARSYCGPPADTVPPQVTSLTFGATTVDLSDTSTLAVTVDAQDTAAGTAASGAKRVEVDVSGPREYLSTHLTLASGTVDNGVWQGTLTFPKRAKPGDWQLQGVIVKDAAGNIEYYQREGTHPDSPTDVRLQSGWDQGFTVTGSAPPPARKPGKLTDFSFTPTKVNTTKHHKLVTVDVTASKPQPKHVQVLFTNRPGPIPGPPKFPIVFDNVTLHRTTHGHWTGELRVRRWLGHNIIRPQINMSYGRGFHPEYRDLDYTQLHARHFPTKLAITSGTDNTPPTLTGLTLSASSVDTTDGAQTVTVTAQASDNKSGVHDISVNLFVRQHGEYQPGGNVETRLKPDGDQWTGQLQFRECVVPGQWKMQVYVDDGAHNEARYSTNKLTAAGLPTEISVTSTPGDVEPPEVEDSTASGADHTITLDFNEPVENVTPQTLTVYADKPASTRFESSLPVASIACSNGTTTAPCSGDGATVTSAVLTVPALEAGQQYEVYANQDFVTSQLTDAAGNPMQWNWSVVEVTGS